MYKILSFNDYLNKDIETSVYVQEVNEGLYMMANKIAKGRVKHALANELEMSKTIMDGIKTGLESLNENFDEIKKGINDTPGKASKGEKQKVLESITKLIEESRKQTWDLNELIDEGEIDYAGFTTDIGLASIAYFGIMLFPVRMSILMHKGYRYFFELIKQTIRKSLVMLQLNFDQFENLIITKSFQSMGYMQEMSENEKISEVYGQLQQMLFNKDTGTIKGKKRIDFEAKFKVAMNKIKQDAEANKQLHQSENAYNCLDQYNNTYTKSLETLRQYSQEDTQKELDSIKNSMQKFAAGDVDLQAYGELLCASAEEHAYKVSASIYNRFAKMTEVFSLPNQKKMIDLIQAATKEKQDAIDRENNRMRKKEEEKLKKQKADTFEKEGVELFKKLDSGAKLDGLDDKTKKYKKVSVDKTKCTYGALLKLNKEQQDVLKGWLTWHTEVRDKCGATLKVAIPDGIGYGGYYTYIDYFVSIIEPSLVLENTYSILNFDEFFLFENSNGNNNSQKNKPKPKPKPKPRPKPKPAQKEKEVLDLSKAEDQLGDTKVLFVKNKSVAIAALKEIGYTVLRDATFAKNAEIIVDKICKAVKSKDHKVNISKSTYEYFKKAIEKLKDEKSHDYPTVQKNIDSDDNQKSED